MKKIILFTLFLTFCAGAVYSETILNYKYNKKEEKKTPIEFVKIKKSYNEYKISYKLKGKIISEEKKEISTQFPFESNTNKIYSSYDEYGNFEYKAYYDFKIFDSKKIIFTFIFDYYNGIKNIGSKKFLLRHENNIKVSNPVKISYQYNRQNNSFSVIQTILYIDEKGELKAKDIDVTNNSCDIINLKEETLYTDYYIKLEEKKKKELEERRKQEEEEERLAKEKKKKELLIIAEKIKNGQDISKYSEKDIKEAFETNFDAIGVYDQYSSNRAIFNIETNKNIYYQPIQILQVFPNKGILGLVTANSFWLGSGAFVKTRPYYIYIDYKKTQNFVSDQFIEIYAKISGTYTYKTVSGGTNTVPKLKGYLVRKIKSYF